MAPESTQNRPSDRQLRIVAVPKDVPDLHMLAQLILGMALARIGEEQRALKDTADVGGAGRSAQRYSS